jgi:hypothetical protein
MCAWHRCHMCHMCAHQVQSIESILHSYHRFTECKTRCGRTLQFRELRKLQIAPPAPALTTLNQQRCFAPSPPLPPLWHATFHKSHPRPSPWARARRSPSPRSTAPPQRRPARFSRVDSFTPLLRHEAAPHQCKPQSHLHHVSPHARHFDLFFFFPKGHAVSVSRRRYVR